MSSKIGLRTKNVSALNINILVVDDEVFNLEIITELLEDAEYNVNTAKHGEDACNLLKSDPEKYHIVLVDRMMPVMDGIRVVKWMNSDPVLKNIPIIMQTAKASNSEIQEGLDAGVLYYLTKPFEEKVLLAIVDTAVTGSIINRNLRNNVKSKSTTEELEGIFEFRTLDEARNIAALLAKTCPNPESVVIGLSELLINAVEHGNLGIGYEMKTKLCEKGMWLEEIERRLSSPEYMDKTATISINKDTHSIRFHIKDAGKGFQSDKFLNIDLLRVVHTHGRGIAMARMMSFDNLRYLGVSNELIATVRTGTE